MIDTLELELFPHFPQELEIQGCQECFRKRPDPTQLCIYLHSWKLSWKEDGLQFETKLPEWTNLNKLN